MKLLPAICVLFYAVGLFAFLSSTHVLRKAQAAISSCTVSVTPSYLTPSGSETFTFALANGGSTDAVWVQITRPSSNFTITGFTAGSWSVSQNASTATFSGGGSVPAGGSQNFYLTVQAGSSEASSANWTVKVSDDAGGASPTTCTGSLGTQISTSSPDDTAPSISDIVVSDVTSSSVKISWTTDESSSTVVEYGTSDSYGSTTNGDGSVTSHSVTISGLSANTTYHYNVKSIDGSSNTGESGDNVFVTAKSGSSGSTQTGSTTIVITPKATPTPIPDKRPPTVSLSTDFSRPFRIAPTIEGEASDPSGVESVFYSIDDGRNWTPVDSIESLSRTRSTFSFTPIGLLDNNYSIRMRSHDGAGNVGVSPDAHLLVIDRLPPRIGGTIFSFGPQVLTPRGQGAYATIVGLSQRLTVSSVGGATEMHVFANDKKVATLQKNKDSGLWSGEMTFATSGQYSIRIHAIDGAKNEVDTDIGVISVLPNSTVNNIESIGLPASVSVYYLDQVSKRFRLWDGASFGQSNPQKTSSTGEYGLYLPRGTYYLRVSSFGYQSAVSTIFTLDEAMPVSANFLLQKARSIRLLGFTIPLPDFRQTQQAMKTQKENIDAAGEVSSLIGGQLPYFAYPYNGSQVTASSLLGKPTVISFLTSWNPQTTAQIALLETLAKNTEVHVVGIMPHESSSSVEIFAKRGGYTIPLLADPDGELFEKVPNKAVPQHVVVDRRGNVSAVLSGVTQVDTLIAALTK